ncbi:MAG: 3-phosphoshikimate 1-carboxyvinyltransferase [Oscillospiraceae bacterium]|jgi:3-phosphoshikimate 1-carboxyvinyltransferase|nr:3-phosphoshikimate 1-carboxyvinyltransferase [Oscillospiraceae bacterium]
MNLTITPVKLSGTVTPPPSKSQAHRLLICAALAGEGSIIHNLADSQDIRATRRCLAELTADRRTLPELDCGESGSTLRFLIPLALALRGGGIFTGHGRLMERPQKPYFDLFEEKGVRYEQKDGVLAVKGRLTPGEYRLPGNVSSQFFTGLLLALPLLDGPSAIIPTTPLESEGYIGMTLDAMREFGVDIASTRSLPPHYLISGGQKYRGAEVTVEGDWSQAAFWYAANCLGCTVDVRGVSQYSTQGDRVIESCCLELSQPGDTEIDMSGCPDLAPPVAAAAAVRQGTTRLVNAGRLRIKESDRLAAITAALNALGARVAEHPDSLTIYGRDSLAGGTVDCCNDHRIAMMAAIAATCCREPVTLLGAECVAKSYPDFWDVYRMLGGIIHEHAGE